jgi:hypothetical protein
LLGKKNHLSKMRAVRPFATHADLRLTLLFWKYFFLKSR